jgi:hypothetical protein
MLNYKELRKGLNIFLANQTKADLESWMKFDQDRMAFAIIKNRVPAKFKNRDWGIISPSSSKENLQFKAGFFIFTQLATKLKCQHQTSNY